MHKIINMVKVNTAWYHDRDMTKISEIQSPLMLKEATLH